MAAPPPASRATPESAPESQDPVRFAVARLHTRDQVVVSLDPGWLKGESYLKKRQKLLQRRQKQEKARHEELLKKKDQQQAAPKQAAGGKHR